MLFTSCATIFTSSTQAVVFSGDEGTKVYDMATNARVAEIQSDRYATVLVKKNLSSKQFLAKREGYRTKPLQLESSFNPISLLNILFWPGFIVDLATGQICKWDNTHIVIDLEKD